MVYKISIILTIFESLKNHLFSVRDVFPDVTHMCFQLFLRCLSGYFLECHGPQDNCRDDLVTSLSRLCTSCIV